MMKENIKLYSDIKKKNETAITPGDKLKKWI